MLSDSARLHLLRADGVFERTTIDREDDDLSEGFSGVRCPHCSWQPSKNSRWSCSGRGTPEPPFDSCGTVWNTFATRGRCPGCDHQWQWTSCLRCTQWALHEDWYVDREETD